MTYKETLFFVGKCLTISTEEKNRLEIEEKLKTNTVNWENVVKLSTDHYVFPALYCNLKRANFLQYLPEDLVAYMQHITDLNRERNQQIIEQAKELNKLLLDNNITPIFLKGTGNLLEGLYEDISERMVGDIDFIFSKEDFPRAIKVLIENGYSTADKGDYCPTSRHYPSLQKEYQIASVEIHKSILNQKYTNEFDYNLIKKGSQIIDNINVMSIDNQLVLSIAAHQINDNGFDFKSIALRNAYDVYLISKKTNAKIIIEKFNLLKNPLNCFLASCFEVLNEPKSLIYDSTKDAKIYLNTFNEQLLDKSLAKKNYRKTNKRLVIRIRTRKIYNLFINREFRKYYIKRVSDKNWRREKLTQLGLIKPKPNR